MEENKNKIVLIDLTKYSSEHDEIFVKFKNK